MRLRSIPRHQFRLHGYAPANEMHRWKPSIAPAKPAAPRNKNAKYEKAIAALERQIKKLGNRPSLRNPVWQPAPPSVTSWSLFLRWHQQKDLRRQIGKLGARVKAGDLTDRKFYVELAKLTTVKRYSDFTERQREAIGVPVPRHYNGFMIYAKPENLWKFLPDLLPRPSPPAAPHLLGRVERHGCRRPWYRGLAPEPERRNQSQIPHWGTVRHESLLEWSRERRSLQSQIDSIRAMMPQASESAEIAAGSPACRLIDTVV